jgi:transposase-like protein
MNTRFTFRSCVVLTFVARGWATDIRSSKYLDNLIEQDHRNIASRTKVMPGLKRFRRAAITISGIELIHRSCNGQFNLATLDLKDIATPTVWDAVTSD